MGIKELIEKAQSAQEAGNRDEFAGWIVKILSSVSEEEFLTIMREWSNGAAA